MLILFLFSFLAGLVTILTPCIWPLLPIILSSSISGSGHKRPLGITLGIMLSFGVITLAISTLIKLFPFDPNILRLLAVVVIAFLGLTMIIPQFSQLTEVLISRTTSFWGQTGQKKGSGFMPGFITGLSLGVVWSPCAGPILASIATLSATGHVSLDVVLITFFYVLGTGIPLFLFAYGGQQILTKAGFISSHLARIQQIFGVLMLLTALAIYTNYDQYLQLKILNAFPGLNTALNGFENNQTVQKQLDILKGKTPARTTLDTLGLFNTSYAAPDFTGVTKWLNTDKPLTMADLKGKVVLVDFWTYTCINCLRTLPHVTAWYDKYHDQGFVVIGVHTPEFEFEKNTDNVLAAIKRYNIHYPVPQDNNYGAWNNFNNQYWPAEYLIDATGTVRRTHFGEGEYDQTEKAIQALLEEAGKKVPTTLVNMPDQTPNSQLSPETYIGSKRMQYYYPGGSLGNGTNSFTIDNNLTSDSFSLGGQWTISDEEALTGKNSVLEYNFSANKVFLVLRPGSAGVNAKVKVILDSKLVDSLNAGQDVKNGVVTVDSDRLYNLIDLRGNPGSHILRLEFQSSGIEVFAFTFG